MRTHTYSSRFKNVWVAGMFFTALVVAGAAQAQAAATDAFDALLKRYVVVSPDGVNRVDYGRWKATPGDRAALDAFIATEATRKPSTLAKNEQFVYWANLYNAITLKVILEGYPVRSIRDIKSDGVWLDPKAYTGPWVGKRVTVEGKELSLDDIEHGILRPTMKDPRVHYSVNCASFGCPNLQPKAWSVTTLDADLDAAARAFVNHPRGVTVKSDGSVHVSSIYSWFKVDFGASDKGVLEHLRKYAAPDLAAKLEKASGIASDSYDWSLNVANGAKS